MDFGFLGGLTGFLEPLKMIYGYFEKSKEKGEVAERLRRGMASIEKFQSSFKALEKVGPSTLSFMESRDFPLDKEHFEELVRKMTEFFDAFNDFLENLLNFGRDCHEISSMTALMERAKNVNSDIYDIIDYFAKHYDPKKKELDLTIGRRTTWKEDKNAEKKR